MASVLGILMYGELEMAKKKNNNNNKGFFYPDFNGFYKLKVHKVYKFEDLEFQWTT